MPNIECVLQDGVNLDTNQIARVSKLACLKYSGCIRIEIGHRVAVYAQDEKFWSSCTSQTIFPIMPRVKRYNAFFANKASYIAWSAIMSRVTSPVFLVYQTSNIVPGARQQDGPHVCVEYNFFATPFDEKTLDLLERIGFFVGAASKFPDRTRTEFVIRHETQTTWRLHIENERFTATFSSEQPQHIVITSHDLRVGDQDVLFYTEIPNLLYATPVNVVEKARDLAFVFALLSNRDTINPVP